MDLRELQRPLKEQYRSDPSSSRITLTARGGEASESMPTQCSVDLGRAIYEAQAHPGRGRPRHRRLLGRPPARRAGRVRAAHVPDGRDGDGPRGATASRSSSRATSTCAARSGSTARSAPASTRSGCASRSTRPDASEEDLEGLMARTERYCTVLQTLRRPPAIEAVRAPAAADRARRRGATVGLSPSRRTPAGLMMRRSSAPWRDRVRRADDDSMHSYVTETPTLGLAGRTRPQWAAAWAHASRPRHRLPPPRPARPAIIAFTVVVTGWATALGLAITLIGLPIAMATIVVSRGMANVERWRAALVLGSPVRGRYRPITTRPDPRAPQGAVRRRPDLEGPRLAPAAAAGRHRRLHRRGLLLGVDGRPA